MERIMLGDALTVSLPCGFRHFKDWAMVVYNHCQWCGVKLKRGTRLLEPTRDHLIPRSKGGNSYLENIVLSCKSCNTLRGNGLPYFKRRFYGPRWQSAPRELFVFDSKPNQGLCGLWYFEEGKLWERVIVGSWEQCHKKKRQMKAKHANGVKRQWIIVPTGVMVAPEFRQPTLRDLRIKSDLRIRAYYKWEAAGRPHGLSDYFWFLAEKELGGSSCAGFLQ